MPIQLSPNPKDTKRALAWLRERAAVDAATWERLSKHAKTRAFRASWATGLQQIQWVKRSLASSIEQGESFDDWKARVRKELRDSETSDALLETTFRNAVQTAYNAARFHALTRPAALKSHPFWQLVVVFDDLTSPYCKPYARPPLIRPATDPWWRANFPPRHHRCRTTVIPLTQRQAERAGITQTPPSGPPQDGWGSTDSLGDWKPDASSFDPDLWAASPGARPEPTR